MSSFPFDRDSTATTQSYLRGFVTTASLFIGNFSIQDFKRHCESSAERHERIARAKESARNAARIEPPRGRAQVAGGRNPCAPLPRRNC